MKVKLEIETSSLLTYGSRPSTGEIYFQFDDFEFPEKGWNDFVDVILNWWILGLTELAENREDRIELDFMDGPFTIEVKRTFSRGLLDLTLMNNHNKKQNKQVQVSEQELLSSIALAINKVIRYYHENELSSDNFDKLKFRFKNFQQSVRKNIN